MSGTRWSICNGEKVMARKDNWIPSVVGFKVEGQMINTEPNVKVSHFIDNDMGLWRRDLVNINFKVEDSKKILGIPFSRRNVEDKQVWHHEKSREYSVRQRITCASMKKMRNPGP